MSEPQASVTLAGGVVTLLLMQFGLGVLSGYKMRRPRRCLACTVRAIRAYIGGSDGVAGQRGEGAR